MDRHRGAGLHALAVALGHLALDGESREVADYSHLLAGCDFAAYVGEYECDTAAVRRRYAATGQGAAGHVQVFFVAAQFQALHLLGGLGAQTFVFVAVTQLLQFQACCGQGGFGLAHALAGAAAQTVEMALVLQFHSEAAQLHLLDLDLHGQLAQRCLVVELQLQQLAAHHLVGVEHLLKVGVGRLQVELQQRSAGADAVAKAHKTVEEARLHGRCYNLFVCGGYASAGVYGGFESAAVHGADGHIAPADRFLHGRQHPYQSCQHQGRAYGPGQHGTHTAAANCSFVDLFVHVAN